MTGAAGPPLEPGSLVAHLRRLVSHSALYGAADVFTNVVNLLLIPVYTAYLSAADYGTLAILLLFGTLAKIVFRLGLDAGFFRVHYDLDTDDERRRLAGTVALFSAAVGTALFAVVVLLAGPLSRLLLRTQEDAGLVVLAAADVYLGTFAFVPLNLLRIQDRPGRFSAFSAGRHALNTLLKVVFVASGHGVAGVLWSDVIATGLFSLALVPTLVRHASGRFSPELLRPALGFGLPKVPHGLLVQVQNLADRKILDLFVTRAEVGVYQMGYTLGAGVKFASSAFEPAWGPFVYSQLRSPDAPRTLARVATYAFAAFAGIGVALAALGPELLVLLTPSNPTFWAGAPVIPVVALAYVLHGLFLVTSVGIGIAKQARYYPIVTTAAACVNVAFNFALIPRFGILGAAWATVLAYAVMAVLGFAFSRRLYPIPFEAARLSRVALAAAAAYAVSLAAPATLALAVVVKLAAVATYAVLLLATGVLRASDRAALLSGPGGDHGARASG